MDNNEFSFKLIFKDKNTFARRGTIHTPHGKIETPTFSPVGTKATVKAISPEELLAIGSQVVLANTYHLYLRPGTEVIEEFDGFANFMSWGGPTITDSGGYQVSFLWERGADQQRSESVKITDKGAYFKSHIDGSMHFLSPEKSMQIQQILGADIIMALDQPMSRNFSEKKNKIAYKRTFDWEERSYKEWERLGKKSIRGTYQALFGIVQGLSDKKLTREFLKFILDLDFAGLAMGGEVIGSDPKATSDTLDTVKEMIPEDKPLHALGLGGGPEGIFAAVERGVDIFDNTSITRMARTGLLFVYPEDGGKVENKFRINIKKSKYASKKEPISKVCECSTCKNYSSAYVNHLLNVNEIFGLRLSTIHNIYFINDLMNKIRDSIENNDFVSLKKEWIG